MQKQKYIPSAHTLSREKQSEVLQKILWNPDVASIDKRLCAKLLQYNERYEDITRIVLTHTEHAMLDICLSEIECMNTAKQPKQELIEYSYVESFLTDVLAAQKEVVYA